MSPHYTRRHFLALSGATGITGLAGCGTYSQNGTGNARGNSQEKTATQKEFDVSLPGSLGLPTDIKKRYEDAISIKNGNTIIDGQALWENDPLIKPITISEGSNTFNGFTPRDEGEAVKGEYAYEYEAIFDYEAAEIAHGFKVYMDDDLSHIIAKKHFYIYPEGPDLMDYKPAADLIIGNSDPLPIEGFPENHSPEATLTPLTEKTDEGYIRHVIAHFNEDWWTWMKENSEEHDEYPSWETDPPMEPVEPYRYRENEYVASISIERPLGVRFRAYDGAAVTAPTIGISL